MGAADRRAAIVIVNGPPGAGKTTLSTTLASMLRAPLLAKDTIKETLWDALGVPDDADPSMWSQQLGGASYEILWALAASAAGDVVIEGPFAPDLTRPHLASLERNVIEIFIRVRPEAIVERDNQRQADRHECHLVRGTISLAEAEAVVERYAPLGLGEVLEVDGEAEPDVDAVSRWVEERL